MTADSGPPRQSPGWSPDHEALVLQLLVAPNLGVARLLSDRPIMGRVARLCDPINGFPVRHVEIGKATGLSGRRGRPYVLAPLLKILLAPGRAGGAGLVANGTSHSLGWGIGRTASEGAMSML